MTEPARSETETPIHAAPQLRRTRAFLRVLLVLAVILPVAFVLWYAWSSRAAAQGSLEADVERMVRIAEEHALKVFEVNEQINQRVLDLLRGKINADIRREEFRYHESLVEIGASIPQISSINVFDPKGYFLASSRFFPVSNEMSIADREDFYHHLNPGSSVFISPLFIGRASGNAVFNLSVARRDAAKNFLGVVNVSLRPEYFADYYKEVTKSANGAAVALVRSDGALIVRYPGNLEPYKFSPDDPALERYFAGEREGTGTFTSPDDNKERFFSFRQVGAYPLYVISSVTTESWRTVWAKHVLGVAAFTFVPSVALWILLIVTLSRLQREEEGWNQWRAEVTERQEVEIAYKQARRLEALGQLTGGVAHDFNNLLMVVSTSTMLLRRQLTDRKDTEQPLGALERSLESGKRLTRQLLAFSRKQPLRPEVLDVQTHIGDFIELVRTSLGGRIKLELDVGPDLRPIHADEAEFELALLNLALNARDAMADGGVLTIRVRNVGRAAGANASINPSTDAVAIAFADTGHGIDPQHVQRVFEPFYTTKAVGRGTGLGLAQVRAFCEEAGGTASVESTVGKGTIVTMLLPASERPVKVPKARAKEAVRQSVGRVLLVEDNPEVADATRILLEQLGYDVFARDSAEAALQHLQHDNDWTLIVSDVLMPDGMSGIELAETLRVARTRSPILLVTGYTAQLEEAKAANLKVLAKPFDAIALRKAIDEIVTP